MARTASGDFRYHVQRILEMAVDDYIHSHSTIRRGSNIGSSHALAAYIVITAAVEAWINEAYLSASAVAFVSKESPLARFDWLEQLELRRKVLLIPQLLYGTSLCSGEAPYQDFDLLVDLRNDLTHFKMNETNKRVNDLHQRGIALRLRESKKEGADFDWISKLSCTEGIIWAHNSCCALVRALIKLDPEVKDPESKPDELKPLYHLGWMNFTPFERDMIAKWLKDSGIDPLANDPPCPPESDLPSIQPKG